MKFSEGGYVESTKEGLIQQMLLFSQCIYSNMTEREAEILGFRNSKKLLGRKFTIAELREMDEQTFRNVGL